MKKIFSIITVLAITAMIVPSSVQALTADELQAQINALMAQLATLQSQLAVLQGTTGTVTGCTITSFDRNLSQGMTGNDVKCLQVVLNSSADTKVAASGFGSAGSETTYFGGLTKAAVIKFQEKYASEVLASYGLTSGTGYVGTTTRAKLNTLITSVILPPGVVCGNGTCETGETSTNCPADCPVTPTAAGLTVALSAITPASTNIATVANANFTKFSLTAGSEGDVSISKIYVTRSGLSDNNDVTNIKIVNAETGVYSGSIGSLNVNSKAMITFIPNLVIPAGTTKEFYIRAGVVTGATSGGTIVLSIASASDVVSNASATNGSAVGNPMTIVALTVGGVAVTWDGTVSDVAPDIGDTDVILNQFKATVDSVEPVTIEQITVKRAGSADASDTANIELYDVTNSKSLGTVANWDINDKASWPNLNIVLGKGNTQRFKVMIDIIDGSGQTVNADLSDGSDVLMSVKGNTYGFYITPSVGSSWTGKGGTATVVNQTIGAGTITITKSASTPATGNVAVGDDILLGIFNFEVKGEDERISQISVKIDVADYNGSTVFTYLDITNVALYGPDGEIVAGPNDLESDEEYTFTDTFIIPVGTHKYTVKCKIGTDGETGDTLLASIEDPYDDITAVGMNTNDAPTISPATTVDVDANTMTIAAADLNVTTLAYPTGRNVAKGVSDFIWATFSLDAATSGEDIKVTAITVTDTVASGGVVTNIDNAELWADLTSANSSRGDVFETRVSDTEQFTVATRAFTLTQVITVPKGSFVKIAIVADATASATNGNHVFNIADATTSVTSIGASTGTSVTENIDATTNVQTMVITDYGVIAVSQDSSAPTADIIIGGKTATLNVFRLTATNVEDMDLDSITLYVTGGNNVDTYSFYNGSTLLGTRPGGTTPRLDLGDGTVTVPANGNVKITVKATMLPIVAGTVSNDTTVGATINAASVVDLTGLASGQPITSTERSVAGAAHQLYESRPTFKVASTSPSGTLIPSTSTKLAVFDVTAEDTEDITFSSTADQLVVNISTSWHTSDNAAGYWYLRDGEGTLLDSYNVNDTATSVTFNFTDSTFTVPAGQTKQLVVWGDTHEFTEGTTWTDRIQLWLDDAADANCTFDIDTSTTGYAEGKIIFKGDKYAGSLSM